jgi:hypothetical protein
MLFTFCHGDHSIITGLCWGQGFGPKVTPDLVAGDRVEIAILSTDPAVSIPEFTADATIIGAEATTVSTPNALTLVVEGVLKQPLDADQGIEQRCVVPELKDTAVGRRDVRAVRELTIECTCVTLDKYICTFILHIMMMLTQHCALVIQSC